MVLNQGSGELAVHTGAFRQVVAVFCAVGIAVALSLGCKSKAKSHSPGATGSGAESDQELSTAPKLHGQKVVLRISTTAVVVEGKSGKRTFKLASARPSAQEVKPIVDQVFAEGGEGGSVWIWGRYDAPYVFDVIGSALSDIPTRLCLRDGSNCSD